MYSVEVNYPTTGWSQYGTELHTFASVMEVVKLLESIVSYEIRVLRVTREVITHVSKDYSNANLGTSSST